MIFGVPLGRWAAITRNTASRHRAGPVIWPLPRVGSTAALAADRSLWPSSVPTVLPARHAYLTRSWWEGDAGGFWTERESRSRAANWDWVWNGGLSCAGGVATRTW